jgi:hypothetical protein
MSRAGAHRARRRTALPTTAPLYKATKRRACASHGWINAVQRADGQWMCPIDGIPAMTQRQYDMWRAERATRRLQGTGG